MLNADKTKEMIGYFSYFRFVYSESVLAEIKTLVHLARCVEGEY